MSSADRSQKQQNQEDEQEAQKTVWRIVVVINTHWTYEILLIFRLPNSKKKWPGIKIFFEIQKPPRVNVTELMVRKRVKNNTLAAVLRKDRKLKTNLEDHHC